MQAKLTQLFQEVLKELGVQEASVSVIPASDPKHGDYASSVAFQAAKKLQCSPLEAAERIKEKLLSFNDEGIQSVQVASPGFVNITLTHEALLKTLQRVVTDGQQQPTTLLGKKIMVEFTDPNPFKEFHIGHLYSNIVGESLSRLFEANGAEVRRVTYQGDVGLHVAKSIWGMQKLHDEMPSESAAVSEKAKFLGKAYAYGATKFEESEEIKQQIIEINKAIYQGLASGEKESQVMKLYNIGKEWSLLYFDTIYERLGSKFERMYFESEAGPKGVEIVDENENIFEKSQGAIIFKGEDYGLHSRVFINSLGLPTYEAKELGLAVTKYSEYPFDLSVMVTGNEINEYFKVLLKVISLIKPEIAEKTRHISHGMVRLPTGKMSSRTGDVITGEWLLSEAIDKAQQKIDESGKVSSDIQSSGEDIAELVGIGAVKYALLKQGIGKDIEFSFDDSISFEGNSGPYLQYTFVRTQSILNKLDSEVSSLPLNISMSVEERELLRMIMLYPEIVSDAAEKLSPSHIATYLFSLAQLFNLFYQKYPILKEEEEIRDFRLGLTKAIGITLKDGLQLLGINCPERM